MNKEKRHISIYAIVFGIVGILIVLFALSTFVFNQNLSAKNVSLANLPDLGAAPNFVGISAWINSPALNITQLRGKVVLVDFWTYSCINCIRSIPYLNAWESKYGNNGLVIVGVHTPEFGFEHNYTNVYNAVQKFGIKYAVALDNNYDTWTAYSNSYWPADYLIDANGNIRYVSIGEGDYNKTEQVIRELLVSAGYNVTSNVTLPAPVANFSLIGTPEIYLGYSRAREALGNTQGFVPNTTVNYTANTINQSNVVYLSGEWYNAPDGMVAVNNSKLFLVYDAKNVNIVAGDNVTNKTAQISVRLLDGSNLTPEYIGNATTLVNGTGVATIGSPRLYNIISGPSYGQHILEISASPGFKVYTFTFG